MGEFYNNYRNILNVLVGGFTTLIGVYFSKKLEDKRQLLISRKKVISFLESIRIELQTINDEHMKQAGQALDSLKEGDPFLVKQNITENYFTIYETHCLLLNDVNDERVKHSIARTYFHLKSFIDSIRTNNKLVEDYEEFSLKYEHSKLGYDSDRKTKSLNTLVTYARSLKRSHNSIQKNINEAFLAIEMYLNKNKK